MLLDVRNIFLLEPDGRLDGRWGTMMMTMTILVVAGQRLHRRRVGVVGVAALATANLTRTATVLKEGRQILAGMRTEIVGTPSRGRGSVGCRITTGLLLGEVGLGRGLERCTSSSSAGAGAAVLLVGCAVGVVVRVHRCGVVVVVAR